MRSSWDRIKFNWIESLEISKSRPLLPDSTYFHYNGQPHCCCPICFSKGHVLDIDDQEVSFYCDECGIYKLGKLTHDCYFDSTRDAETSTIQADARFSLSCYLAKNRYCDPPSSIDTALVELHVENPDLFSPLKLMDAILRDLGSSGSWRPKFITSGKKARQFGAHSLDEIDVALDAMKDAGLIKEQFETVFNAVEDGKRYSLGHALTVAGWDRYEKLKRGLIGHGAGFLAMKFGTDIDTFLPGAIKACCNQVGLSIRRLDDVPSAGLIDEQMIVAIREARFLVVDLTHDSSGAYWEAGFAHGLGKPVVYTCEAGSVVHFDVRNWQRVEWERSDMGLFQKKLAAVLRLTLPLDRTKQGL